MDVTSGRDGVLIKVCVTPSAKRDALELNPWENSIKVKVAAPPREGKANTAVIRFFKNIFGNCEIRSGLASRRKTLIIRGWDREKVMDVLTKENNKK